MKDKLKVLVVDDSLVYRGILTQAVDETGLGEVIYTASNGELALERLEQGEIDVILLDVYMPGMDGLETLSIIKERYPDKAVIMISGGGADSAELTMKALEIGAIDFILKPSGGNTEKNMRRIRGYLHVLFAQILTNRYSREFRGRIETSKDTKTAKWQEGRKNRQANRDSIQKDIKTKGTKIDEVEIILIASSTGGPIALEKIFSKLPSNLGVPILVVQHMPPAFTKMLSQTLDKKSSLDVGEGAVGDKVEANKIFLAPGGQHMIVKSRGYMNMIIELEDTPQVHGVRPAADVLFSSVAKAYEGRDVLAIVLTGMGNDGTDGVRDLKDHCNCYCITQSEDSCVVFGMPKSVSEAGLSDEEVHIDDIAGRIIDIVLGGG